MLPYFVPRSICPDIYKHYEKKIGQRLTEIVLGLYHGISAMVLSVVSFSSSLLNEPRWWSLFEQVTVMLPFIIYTEIRFNRLSRRINELTNDSLKMKNEKETIEDSHSNHQLPLLLDHSPGKFSGFSGSQYCIPISATKFSLDVNPMAFKFNRKLKLEPCEIMSAESDSDTDLLESQRKKIKTPSRPSENLFAINRGKVSCCNDPPAKPNPINLECDHVQKRTDCQFHEQPNQLNYCLEAIRSSLISFAGEDAVSTNPELNDSEIGRANLAEFLIGKKFGNDMYGKPGFRQELSDWNKSLENHRTAIARIIERNKVLKSNAVARRNLEETHLVTKSNFDFDSQPEEVERRKGSSSSPRSRFEGSSQSRESASFLAKVSNFQEALMESLESRFPETHFPHGATSQETTAPIEGNETVFQTDYGSVNGPKTAKTMSKTIPDRFIFNEDKIATNQEQHTLKKTAQSQDLDLGSRLVVKDLSRFKILEVPWNRPTTSNCSKQTSSEPEQEGHALALDSEPMTGHFIIKSFNRTALREKCDEYKNICPQARNIGDGSWYQRPIVRMAKRRSRLTRKGEQLDLATKCVLELLTSSEEDISTQPECGSVSQQTSQSRCRILQDSLVRNQQELESSPEQRNPRHSHQDRTPSGHSVTNGPWLIQSRLKFNKGTQMAGKEPLKVWKPHGRAKWPNKPTEGHRFRNSIVNVQESDVVQPGSSKMLSGVDGSRMKKNLLNNPDRGTGKKSKVSLLVKKRSSTLLQQSAKTESNQHRKKNPSPNKSNLAWRHLPKNSSKPTLITYQPALKREPQPTHYSSKGTVNKVKFHTVTSDGVSKIEATKGKSSNTTTNPGVSGSSAKHLSFKLDDAGHPFPAENDYCSQDNSQGVR